jgi:hypothetical protein
VEHEKKEFYLISPYQFNHFHKLISDLWKREYQIKMPEIADRGAK